MVVELVGAFNELTERMGMLSSSGSQLLFKALKLSIPLLHALPLTPDGRSSLSRALSISLLLADLQVWTFFFQYLDLQLCNFDDTINGFSMNLIVVDGC